MFGSLVASRNPGQGVIAFSRKGRPKRVPSRRLDPAALNRADTGSGHNAATVINAPPAVVAEPLPIPRLGRILRPVQWGTLTPIGTGICLAASRQVAIFARFNRDAPKEITP